MEKRGVCPGEGEEPKEKQAQDRLRTTKVGDDILSRMIEEAINNLKAAAPLKQKESGQHNS